MVAARQSLDFEGDDVYLASKDLDEPGNADRLARPILFLAGQHNQIFFPDTSRRTLHWLQAANPGVDYSRVVLADYVHLDSIIGRTANVDVFPHVLEHLDQTNPKVPAPGSPQPVS